MADKKISQLNSSIVFGDLDEIAINRGGISMKSTGLMVSQYIGIPLQNQITTNATNIATNTANLTTTTAAVTTNTTDIATNATAIATNTGAVGVNTTSIGTNTGNIATNTAGIATNTAAIAAIPNVNTLYPLLGANTAKLIFFGTGTNIDQDANLVWDPVGKRLGIGSNIIPLFPEYALHIKGTAQQYGIVTSSAAEASFTCDGAPAVANSAFLGLSTNGVGMWQVATDPTDSNRFKISPAGFPSYALGIDHSTGNVEIRNGARLSFSNTLNTFATTIRSAPTIAANTVYTLPIADAPLSGQPLTSNAAGVLSFAGMPQTVRGFDTGTWSGASTDIDSFNGVISTIVAWDGALQTHLSVRLTNTSTSLHIVNMPNMIDGMVYTVLISNVGVGDLDSVAANHGSELKFPGGVVPSIDGTVGTGTLFLLQFTASMVGPTPVLLCELVGQFD